ncbi:DUF4184 family protein [Flavobacterium sp. DGU38]|uniref:DUF4184 family protein n=1 Tax=Flavobacterium calami TaxID=3139144 RepID=A0ABU9ITI4_9FLAO
MPFTFSHPAIVLPLNYLPKNWFSLTGLIIGSMVPDFEYFIRMKVKSIYSHTLDGIFWFDFPFALLLCFLFHNIVKKLLFQNLPKGFQIRFSTFKEFDWNNYFKNNWFVIIISILIGTVSHLFWDSFTHDHGYFVNHISSLQKTFIISDIKIPALKIAQHSSTAIGGAIILYAFFKLPKSSRPISSINKNYWILLLLISTMILFFRFNIGLETNEYGNIIVSVIASILLSLIFTPLVLTSNKFSINQKIN